MKKLMILTLSLILAACATEEEHNQKDIPVTTGAAPQRGIIVSAPAGTMGHGRF